MGAQCKGVGTVSVKDHSLTHLYSVKLTYKKTKYRIAGNFRGRKLSRIFGNEKFAEKTFVDRREPLIMSGCGRRFSWEKTFADSPKILKFAKVFSLESFPLYGTCIEGSPSTSYGTIPVPAQAGSPSTSYGTIPVPVQAGSPSTSYGTIPVPAQAGSPSTSYGTIPVPAQAGSPSTSYGTIPVPAQAGSPSTSYGTIPVPAQAHAPIKIICKNAKGKSTRD